MRNAKFRYKANIEQLHFDIDRNLDKNQFMRMAECTFVGRKENLLITGSTGIGKSFIASAIGNQACTSVLMEIVEDRHGNRSNIITSQLPVAQWYEVIGEQTIADAILDRIVHDAHRMELVRESIRKRQRNKNVETVESE